MPAEIRGPKVRVITKAGDDGDGTKQVMDLLAENAPMILTIRAAEVAIRKEMAALFSKSIWPRWKLWLEGKEKPDAAVTAAVSRHLASRVYASLLEKADEQLHSEEWYFVPPIRDGLRTGDLVELKTSGGNATQVAIVVTPRCDLSNNPGNKNSTYQLAMCEDVSEDWGKRLTSVMLR